MKKIVTVAVAGALLLSVSACGSNAEPNPNYVGVCEDAQGNRVDDSYCNNAQPYSNNGSSGFFWGYLLASSMMPRYGQHVDNSVRYVDQRQYNVYRGGVPATGGAINYDTYKPKASSVVKPDVSVKSKKYKDAYIQQDSTYKKKDTSKNNVYKAPANNKPVYKAPSKR